MAQAATTRLTIRQIADLAGVSIATVSRVLNGRGDVADETRDLVSRVIRENGYTANRSARGLSAGRTGLDRHPRPARLPGVLLVDPRRAQPRRSPSSDLQIVLSPTGQQHDREVSVLDRLHGVTDGALIILPEESNEELERMLDGGYRFVVLDPLMPLDERIPSVSAAHTSGADQAMRHLLELGHRRIAQISGPPGWLATEDRRRGYRAALASAGILPDPALEAEPIPEIGPGREAAEQLLDLAEPPTAIFAFNDNIAIGAIAGGARTRAARAGGPLGRRLRRRRACDGRDAGADDGAPAARGDGTHRGQPAEPAARAAALRDAPCRARDAARRARVDGTAARDLRPFPPGPRPPGAMIARP